MKGPIEVVTVVPVYNVSVADGSALRRGQLVSVSKYAWLKQSTARPVVSAGEPLRQPIKGESFTASASQTPSSFPATQNKSFSDAPLHYFNRRFWWSGEEPGADPPPTHQRGREKRARLIVITPLLASLLLILYQCL